MKLNADDIINVVVALIIFEILNALFLGDIIAQIAG